MSEGRDETSGRFLPGNRLWEARSSHGRNPKFETAEDLWSACCEYFEWVDANPLHEQKVFNGKDGIVKTDVTKMRAMTIGGLCLFLDISRETWTEWRKSRADFSEVIRAADEVIYSQKFSGAAADLLNANIIARDLGLSDKQEHTGKDGGPIETKDTSDLEVARRVAFLLSKATKADA